METYTCTLASKTNAHVTELNCITIAVQKYQRLVSLQQMSQLVVRQLAAQCVN